MLFLSSSSLSLEDEVSENMPRPLSSCCRGDVKGVKGETGDTFDGPSEGKEYFLLQENTFYVSF